MSTRPWIHLLVSGALLLQALAPMQLASASASASSAATERVMPCHAGASKQSLPDRDCCDPSAGDCANHCGGVAFIVAVADFSAVAPAVTPDTRYFAGVAPAHQFSFLRPPIAFQI